VKDSSKGMSAEWERFDFNKEAPLDDDTKLDHFGGGLLIVYIPFFLLHVHFQLMATLCQSFFIALNVFENRQW
jgi:hypothetical protein